MAVLTFCRSGPGATIGLVSYRHLVRSSERLKVSHRVQNQPGCLPTRMKEHLAY